MQKVNRLHYLLFLFLITTIAACQKENQQQNPQKNESLSISEKVSVPISDDPSGFKKQVGEYNTFYGPQVQMGNGHVRSWINITRKDDIPLAIGIEFTSKSFENLPGADAAIEDNRFDLRLHQKAMAVTPFDHITLNWEPNGHEPVGIYNVPHFDMHFYKISIAEQMAITGTPTAPPLAGYLPVTYVIKGATVPQMGTHWLDPFNSPELHGAPFSHTFIYGSNNGNVHFLEPMITRAFLMSGLSFGTLFPQPTRFSPSGIYYPTWYRIWRDAENGRTYVALTDFAWR
jgi:hypothetical protein